MFDLNNIKIDRGLIFLIFTLNNTVPAFLAIFLFRNDLFLSLDMFKLLVLSVSLSVPFSIGMMFLVFIYGSSTLKLEKVVVKKRDILSYFGLSTILTSFSWFYSGLFLYIKWGIFQDNVSYHTLIILHLASIASCAFVFNYRHKINKKELANTPPPEPPTEQQ